jgi:hypothetical protein
MSNKMHSRKTVVNRIDKQLWEDFLVIIQDGLYERAAVIEDALRDWIKNKERK